jgi:1-acyl-sn-glycerol-3-phosphate acyltransferase
VRGALAAVFLFTTLIAVNGLETLSLVLRPFSRGAFRHFNRQCADWWWGMCVSVSQMADIRPIYYGDELPMRENAIVVCNHQQMPDIVALMMLARCKGRLGDMKWFVKDVLKFVPGVGWGMLFLDCLFIKRNWDADAGHIRATFSKIIDQKIPLWLISFSEGTRITAAKLARTREYANKQSLPLPEHVLIPRTKGFVASVEGLRGHIQAVYDVTIAYPEGIPTLWQYFRGLASRIHLRVKRCAVEELPTEPAALSGWLLERFREKDRLLSYFFEHGVFPAQ